MLRLCLLILSFALLDTLGQIVQESPTPRLKLIGNYNGHAYSYNNTLLTWNQANAYCVKENLKLAEISSLNNLRLFQNYHAADAEFVTNVGYWLAGVDSKTPSQFIWADTKNEMDTELVWTGFNGPYTCVSYYNKGLNSYPCANTRYVICQS